MASQLPLSLIVPRNLAQKARTVSVAAEQAQHEVEVRAAAVSEREASAAQLRTALAARQVRRLCNAQNSLLGVNPMTATSSEQH